jgi:hypothetical protein
MPVMVTLTFTPVTWSWSIEVLAFAAEHQIDPYLEALLDATQQTFPAAQVLRLVLVDDPEIRPEGHIIFEVHLPPGEAGDHAADRERWHQELERLCPAGLRKLFGLVVILLPG